MTPNGNEKLVKKYEKVFGEFVKIYTDQKGDADCTKCGKEIKNIDENLKHSIDPFKRSERGLSNIRFDRSELKFLAIPSRFIVHSPLFLCEKCKNMVWRFVGKIPDVGDTDCFPNRLINFKNSEWGKKKLQDLKKYKCKIHYKDKMYEDKPEIFNRLLKKAVKIYLKKNTECVYTELGLYRAIKNKRIKKEMMVI